MKSIITLGIGGSLLFGAVLMPTDSRAQQQAAAEANSGTSGIHSITLPQVQTNLPAGPGQEFIGNCAICHSPRYILNQPPLSRKQWTAEVDKMRKTFGAPIPDGQVPVIIDYLMSVRGAPEGPPAAK